MGNSPARSALDVGSVVGGTYTLEALIGRGGMGAVFLARNNRLPSKKVAIKLLHIELHDDEVIARFRREATIASELDHPNIVRVDDYNVTDDGTPYLVLEYLQGESLAARIAKGPMPLDQVTSIVRQVGSALAAAHRAGIVHRDLKPQNVFLVPLEVDGRVVEIAKVLDFGISKIRGSQTVQTQESTLLGTPQYMAPEQATGQHASVDERTDIFAFGAIVYEMLCGQPAFTGQSIPEVVFKVVYEQPPPLASRAAVAPALAEAVERAMAKPADARFPTMSAFVEALTGQPLPQPRASLAQVPEVGFAHGSQRGDAYANTVDSGQHAKSLGVPPPESAAINPHAQTIASHAGGEIAPAPAPPARRGRLLVPLGFALLVGGGLAAFVMTRGDRREHAAAPPAATADAPPAQAPDAAAVVAAAPVDAAPPTPADAALAALPVDAAPAASSNGTPPRPRPPRPPPDPVDDDPAAGGDEPLDGKLREAYAAFAARQYAKAERFANEIVDTSTVPRQVARAHVLRAAIACVHENNRGKALANLRAVRTRRARAFAISACRSVGIDVR